MNDDPVVVRVKSMREINDPHPIFYCSDGTAYSYFRSTRNWGISRWHGDVSDPVLFAGIEHVGDERIPLAVRLLDRLESTE